MIWDSSPNNCVPDLRREGIGAERLNNLLEQRGWCTRTRMTLRTAPCMLHMYGWVMSRTRMSHVTHAKELCNAKERRTRTTSDQRLMRRSYATQKREGLERLPISVSHAPKNVNGSCHAYKWGMWNMCKSHSAHKSWTRVLQPLFLGTSHVWTSHVTRVIKSYYT